MERFAPGAATYVSLLGETLEALAVDPDVFEWVQRERGQQVERVKLPSLRSAVHKYPCVILLGDPGSGKTTGLRALAQQAAAEFHYPPTWLSLILSRLRGLIHQAAAETIRLPLLVSLREFGPGQGVEQFLVRSWGGALSSDNWGAPELAAHLEEYLAAGRLLLLCDALNEMPRQGYAERVAALRTFIDRWAARGNRFVVSCRVLDYGGELEGLQRVEVQPFNDGQIQEFLQKRLPEDGRRPFWDELQEGPDVRRRLLELVRNPMNLAIMAAIYRQDRQLSQSRAGLLQRFSEILLERAKDKCPAGQWLEDGIQKASLGVLAYEMGARSSFGGTVETVLAQEFMPAQVEMEPGCLPIEAPPERVLALAASAHILEMPVDRSTVRFYHQLLQEHFAALELRRRVTGADAATLAKWWRWPWLEAEMPPWVRPEGNWDPLPAPPPTGWEETTILAAGLVENDDQLVRALLAVNPALAGRCLHEGQARVAPAVRQAVIEALLTAIGDGAVALRVRLAAGEVLGYLGDPRLGEMVSVAAGKFKMGSAAKDKQANDDEKPQHIISLPEYRLGKYPVTNAEYARFVAAKGYQQPRWWTEAGWDWKKEEKRTEPDYWQDLRFNKPNQPVVGVSWYEAVAYCRWLSAELQQTVRLPSEAQWEKGARGTDGRVYPWGNTFDAGRLNSGEGEQAVRGATPVGIYPGGAGPYGAFDCAGNVDEFCATRWGKPYPYDAKEDEWQEAYLAGDDRRRVLRGGAFYYSDGGVRCAYRLDDFPHHGGSYIGFRVAASPLPLTSDPSGL
ncbi:MAG: NACHT domain-containing protein [Chloroflexi bacterium]|nr:NACHT domain-containing protein [Chloroflexota bacterium]